MSRPTNDDELRQFLQLDANATKVGKKDPNRKKGLESFLGHKLKNAAKSFTEKTVSAAAAAEVTAVSGSPLLGKLAGAFVKKHTSNFFDDVDELIDQLFHGLKGQVKFHGNWGGPLWSGGQYLDADQPIDPALWDVPATDPLDQIYKIHDIHYAYAATLDRQDIEGEMRAADKECVDAITAALEAGEIPAEAVAKAAMSAAIFKAKLALGGGYDPPEIRVADPAAKRLWRSYYARLLKREHEADLMLLHQTLDLSSNNPTTIFQNLLDIATEILADDE